MLGREEGGSSVERGEQGGLEVGSSVERREQGRKEKGSKVERKIWRSGWKGRMEEGG